MENASFFPSGFLWREQVLGVKKFNKKIFSWVIFFLWKRSYRVLKDREFYAGLKKLNFWILFLVLFWEHLVTNPVYFFQISIKFSVFETLHDLLQRKTFYLSEGVLFKIILRHKTNCRNKSSKEKKIHFLEYSCISFPHSKGAASHIDFFFVEKCAS